MTVPVQNAAPSTLAGVIGQVIDAFQEMGDATPIMVGAHYLEHFGQGVEPRVLFVPEQGASLGPPSEMGNAASVMHSCDVYVRAAQGLGDVERFERAYALADRVVACIVVAATGRYVWGKFEDSSPTTDGDAELHFSFTYKRDIPHSVARWTLAAAGADASPRRPGIPPGVPGQIDSVNVATVPKEP